MVESIKGVPLITQPQLSFIDGSGKQFNACPLASDSTADGHDFYTSRLGAAGAATGSAATGAGASAAGDAGSFSTLIFGEGGTGRDDSIRAFMTMRTGRFFIGLTERP